MSASDLMPSKPSFVSTLSNRCICSRFTFGHFFPRISHASFYPRSHLTRFSPHAAEIKWC